MTQKTCSQVFLWLCCEGWQRLGPFEVDPEIRASSEVVSLWWLRVGISTPDPDIPSESQT